LSPKSKLAQVVEFIEHANPTERRAIQLALLGIQAGQHHGVMDQPVSRITWVEPEILSANDYNPNHVAPPEMKLLRLSILEDGWTQPIVARPDGEIVDGYHRYMLGTSDNDVRALTSRLVPVAPLRPADAAHQRMSTIRHNRARGEHGVLPMADIVAQILQGGISDEEAMKRLGMDREELRRLKERGDMRLHSGQDEFGKAWAPAARDT
jgi:ParB-like chromosome segregation protein Spo0J